MSWFEIVGYVASALVVVSLAMSSVVRLRVINFLGCATFAVYGLLIGAWPIVASNTIIAVFDVYYLLKELRYRKDVGAVPIAPDAPYLQDFLHAHADDILRFQPDFAGIPSTAKVWLLTRDGLPAGVLAGQPEGTTLRILLDHVTPAYRDSRLGRWLFSGDGATVLRDAGFTRAVSTSSSPKHRPYLTSLGFHADGSDLVKEL